MRSLKTNRDCLVKFLAANAAHQPSAFEGARSTSHAAAGYMTPPESSNALRQNGASIRLIIRYVYDVFVEGQRLCLHRTFPPAMTRKAASSMASHASFHVNFSL